MRESMITTLKYLKNTLQLLRSYLTNIDKCVTMLKAGSENPHAREIIQSPPLEGDAQMNKPEYRSARALMDARLREMRQPATGGWERWLARQQLQWLHRAFSQLVTLGERLQASDQAESYLRHGGRPI